MSLLGNNSSSSIKSSDDVEEEEVPEEIEVEEIEEVISAIDDGSEVAAVVQSKVQPQAEQKQQHQQELRPSTTTRALFNLDSPGSQIDYGSDELLKGENIAAHFQPEDESLSDSLDQILNDLRLEDGSEARGQSPQSEVILLNDQIVSINSLKEKQEHTPDQATTTNCSTTNDISEIVPDENTSKSSPKYSEVPEEEKEEELKSEEGTQRQDESTPVPSNSSEVHSNKLPPINPPRLQQQQPPMELPRIITEEAAVKPMERCLDFGKEVLEDISEESEQALESLKVDQLRVYSVTSKPTVPHSKLVKTFSEGSFFDPNHVALRQDAEMGHNSLDTKLNQTDSMIGPEDGAQSKESLKDHSSIVTNTSTEYRLVQDEYITRMHNIKSEITERDQLIEKLTESLQESLKERDTLQEVGLEMADELQVLKSQLSEAVESLRQSRRAETDVASQRLSEVSMDLVSDEEDLYPGTTSEKRETIVELAKGPSKQIEEFQKYLNAEELRIFFMVQKKFDSYLEEELEKVRLKHDGELKLLKDSLETEKQSRELMASSVDVAGMKEELQAKHAQEMAGLREYFEKKCTELEKQYSEEVFSQSQKHSSMDSESEISGAEEDELPIGGIVISPRSPKKSLQSVDSAELKGKNAEEVKVIFEERMRSMNQRFEEQLNVLRGKLQHYERRNADDELMTNESTHAKEEGELRVVDRPKEEGHSININSLINNNNNNSNSHKDCELNELNEIIAEYDRRLQEQVTLARQDVLVELEKNIQALLSETATEDSHWPPELILIREKFTAKNQLQLTQLQIQHADEMSRVKQDYERQMNRKLKRHTTFDSNRNLDHVVSERDNLRELSVTLRRLLCEVAKYYSICESDLNNTLGAELKRHGAFNETATSSNGNQEEEVRQEVEGALNETVQSENGLANQSASSTATTSNSKKNPRLSLDMSSILTLIDDPSLVEYISRPAGAGPTELEFDLEQCLEQLKLEASHILRLSERIARQNEGLSLHSDGGSDVDEEEEQGEVEKGDDSCEEQEDGLKSRSGRAERNGVAQFRQSSSVDISPKRNGRRQRRRRQEINGEAAHDEGERNGSPRSLPSIKSLYGEFSVEEQQKIKINFNELKNRLQKSEDDRRSLEVELSKVRSRNSSLIEELAHTKEILEIRREDVCEGFGANSPVKGLGAPRMAFSELQEKAKALLNSSATSSAVPNVSNTTSAAQLLQFIEDFCREGDRVVDENKKDRVDLQKQKNISTPECCGDTLKKIEAADRQLKSTRQFLEEQATERELERDEFGREIERLKAELKDREKGKSSHDLLKKEIQSLETQLREMTVLDTENGVRRQKLEEELKASVDKMFVLREIITGLEKQTEESADRELMLQGRVEELEELVKSHTQHNESVQQESLQMELDGRGYQHRIIELEDKLTSLKPSAEQSLMFEQLSEQLKEIETMLETKTKTLESLHAEICSQSCSSPSEDVSVRHLGGGDNKNEDPVPEDVSPRSNPSTYTVDRMQRVLEKLQKHTQVEQAAIKRMKDLEQQMQQVRATNLDLQHEKDMLQERMSEHLLRISTLQSRLDEQRYRVEELHRQGTTDLTLRVHDLQMELSNAQEMLSSKEKQITTLRGHLEQSKVIIARQEEQIATGGDEREPNEVIEGLEMELHAKCEEIHKLREKIKSEMVNKMALPDLMETIMAEKNEEIDALKESLERKEQFLEIYAGLDMNDDQLERVKRLTREVEQQDVKLSARTLSDVVSISDYDVPDVMRRAESRHVMAEGLTLNQQQTFDFVRGCSTQQSMAKCTPGLPEARMDSAVEANMMTITPEPIPRHINFSLMEETKENNSTTKNLGEELDKLRGELRQRVQENAKLQREMRQKAELLDGLAKEAENVKGKLSEFEALQQEVAVKDREMELLKAKLTRFEAQIEEFESKDLKSLVRPNQKDSLKDMEHIGLLEEEVDAMKRILTLKDEQLAKLEKETLNYARIEKNYEMEMSALRKDLIGKSLALEKCKLDLDESINNVLKLHLQLERVKERYESNAAILPLQLDDDLAEKVEEELNYSARLDSSILKAIESDDLGSAEEGQEENQDEQPQTSKSVRGLILQADHLDDELWELKRSLDREATRNEELLAQNHELNEQLGEFKQKYETERSNCVRMQLILESEKKSSLTLQQQDAELLDQMRQRLEEAMENETQLQRILDDERTKVDRLSNVLQRSKSRECIIKSPVESSSPRRAGPNDPEVLRLEGELRLVGAQNERERERVKDLHKTLERERERFEKEVHDQKLYSEKLTADLKQAVAETGKVQDDLETVQEKLAMAHGEIDSLEARISNYEDIDERASNKRSRDRMDATTQQRLESQDLKLRLHAAEKEREHLQTQVMQLRQDVERCTYREVELTRALAAEDRDQEHIAGQLNEMRARMTDALEQLAEERRLNQVDRCQVACKEELEERANHLFGKYLRVESFRKALVHQKRYLLIVLSAYQENETKTMLMLKGSAAIKKTQERERMKRLFKSAVLAVIAIQRMRFIVQRWQSGKRIGAKAIFSSHMMTPRRSASASTNVWVGQFGGGGGGPSRERSHFTATVSTQQQMHQTPQLLSSVREHSSPFQKYYRH